MEQYAGEAGDGGRGGGKMMKVRPALVYVAEVSDPEGQQLRSKGSIMGRAKGGRPHE
jgi:hypothetical protein